MAQTAGINRFSISVLHITTGLFWTQNNWNTHRHILPENPSYFSSFDGFFPCPTWLTWFRSSRCNADRCQLVQSRSHTRYRLLMACLCVHRGDGGGFGMRVGEGHWVGRHHQPPCSHIIRSDLTTQELSVEVCMSGFHTSSPALASPASSSHRGWIERERERKNCCFFSIWI